MKSSMLKILLIYISKANWVRRIIMSLGFARKTAMRFVGGETLEDAIRATKQLNKNGLTVTLDLLGENVETTEESNRSAETILTTLEEIEEANVLASVSIKLSQLGIGIDENFCGINLKRILQKAADSDNFVRIDMEDSSMVDATIRMHKTMRSEGFNNIGLVIQSYLFRSVNDTRELLDSGSRIRLVKGAYQEPHTIAFAKKKDVDTTFDRLTEMVFDQALASPKLAEKYNGKIPPIPAIATHDEKRIDFAIRYAEEIGLDKDQFEFQMLYGIRRRLQEKLVSDNFKVRIYVPFGTEWFPYFMRRLAERPANLWFFVTSLFSK